MAARACRPWMLAALLVLSCSIATAACGGSDSESDSGGGSGKFPTGDVTLTIWDTAEDTKNNLFKEELIPAYEAKHPNVKVEYSFYPTADLAAKEFVALGNGQGPSIFSVQGTNFAKMFAGDFVAPAEDVYFPNGGVKGLEDQYLPGALDSITNEGKLYALPNQQNSWSMFINNRLFKEAGLDPVEDAPKTWDDVARLNEKLIKEEGGRVTQKGFDFRYQAGDNWLIWAFSFLNYQAGDDVLTDDEPQWTGPEGVKAMETWKATTSAPEISNNTGSSPYQDFADEKEALALGGPNMGKFVVSINPKMAGNYTVVPMPQMDPANPVTFFYSFNLAVNSNLSADERLVAWDFIDFALKDPLQWWEATAMLQPRKGAYDSPEAQKTVGMDVFVKDLELAKPLARTVYWDELQRIIGSAAQGMVLEDRDIQESLDSAADEFRRVAGK